MLDFLTHLDYAIFNQINNVLNNSFFDVFFFWITDLHKTIYFKVIIVPFVLFLFIKKYRRMGINLFLILLVSLGINDFIGGKVKDIVKRERPVHNQEIHVTKRTDAGSFSFYSNHSANMFTFASYTAALMPEIKIPLYTIATLVAYSRVYNGVHYPSDILAGGLIGFIWGKLSALFAAKLMSRFKQRKKNS